MWRSWVVVVVAAVSVLLGVTACGTADPVSAPAGLSEVLPEASDFESGVRVDRLDADEELIMSLNIHAPSDGIGLDMNPMFDPTECEAESLYADYARAGLIENGAGRAVYFDEGGAYLALVSETGIDVARVAEAHTGECSSYSVASNSFGETSRHTIQTERMDLPPALESEDAVILYEIMDLERTDRVDYEMLLGYAAVGGYSVVVLSYEGMDSRAEFEDVFTRVVQKIRRLS